MTTSGLLVLYGVAEGGEAGIKGRVAVTLPPVELNPTKPQKMNCCFFSIFTFYLADNAVLPTGIFALPLLVSADKCRSGLHASWDRG